MLKLRMRMRITTVINKMPVSVRGLVWYKFVCSKIIVLFTAVSLLVNSYVISWCYLLSWLLLIIIEALLIKRKFSCPHCGAKSWWYGQKVIWYYLNRIYFPPKEYGNGRQKIPACPKCENQYE